MKRRILKTNQKPLYKKHILIVDGGLNIATLLNFILAREYHLTIKTNGIDALTWLEEGNDPDLVITSLRMPYFDGGTFIKNLRLSGLYRDTPVLLLSGDENLANKVEEMSFRIDGYLEKPFDPSVLKSQITQLIA